MVTGKNFERMLIRRRTILARTTAWILRGIDSYQVWIFSKRLFLHSSFKTVFCSCSDNSGGYRLLNVLLFRMHYKCSIILRSRTWSDQIRCSISQNVIHCHSVTDLAVWIRALSYWKFVFHAGNSLASIMWISSDTTLK